MAGSSWGHLPLLQPNRVWMRASIQDWNQTFCSGGLKGRHVVNAQGEGSAESGWDCTDPRGSEGWSSILGVRKRKGSAPAVLQKTSLPQMCTLSPLSSLPPPPPRQACKDLLPLFRVMSLSPWQISVWKILANSQAIKTVEIWLDYLVSLSFSTICQNWQEILALVTYKIWKYLFSYCVNS